ncbi:MAG TPA: hypothetical protein VGP95_21025 [Gemmatimonadaceae bacterium]|nr:hypothetical protein [Gemmatimonadaceae bacterium]
MIVRTPALAACAALVLAMPAVGRAQAQKTTRTPTPRARLSPECTWKPTDAWVKRQAEFFDETKHDWTNDSLRNALLEAAGLKAPLRVPVQFGVHVEGSDSTPPAAAAAMIDALKKLASTRGSTWPTRSVVGAAGTHAVYVLVGLDTTLAKTALHRMMEAGPVESPAPDVATLEDRLRLLAGRKQIYGTQFRRGPDGKVQLAPMEDSTHADLRREGAALPPFKLGMCMAGKG